MNCPLVERKPEMLIAYAAGELDAGAASELEVHLAACAECQAMAAEQLAVWNALDVWEAPPVSEDFNRRLYSRIAEEMRPSWWQRIFQSLRPMQAVPLAAAACLLLVASFIVQPPRNNMPVNPGSETVRVDQVERTLDDLDTLHQMGLANDVDSQHSDSM